jgi:universal stress protein A
MSTKNQPTADLPRISRILVATDFSDQASKALEWAQSVAAAFGARLVLLHVIDIASLAETSCVMAGPDPLPLFREQARQCMDELKRLIPDAETVVREGSPRPAIVNAALELDCQMIIMGTHGRSGLAHLLLGSVAEYVVRNGKVPVLTVRAANVRSEPKPRP